MNVKRLTRREFARAIRLGHGRALLHVKHYGDKGIEEEIEDALVRNHVYDMQVDGLRTYWLISLLILTGNLKKYAKRVLISFEKERRSYDLVQQITLCGVFFELGYSEFRPLMFRKFLQLKKNPRDIDLCGCELVDVAGLLGLEFVAKAIGGTNAVSDYECGKVLKYAKTVLDESPVNERMNELLRTNANVKAFVDATVRDAQSDLSGRLESSVLSLKEVLDLIRRREAGLFNLQGRRFGREASDADLLKVYDLLLESTDPYDQRALLQIFSWRQLPEFDNKLLDLVDSESRQVRRAASNVLSTYKHFEVRKKALTLLNTDRCRKILLGLELLKVNYQKVDSALIAKKLMLLKKREQIHSAGMALSHLAENSGGAELAGSFHWLYEHGPDSFCRERFLKQLISWEACPERFLYESQWDSGDEVQILANCRMAELQIAKFSKIGMRVQSHLTVPADVLDV